MSALRGAPPGTGGVMREREAVNGNRLMLVGAVLYLLEWVAIIPAGDTGPSELGKTASSTIVSLYQGHARGAGFIAGWCAVVLMGRILIVLGARQALRGVRHQALADWAVVVMGVSIAVEVVEVALIAGTSHATSAATVDDSVVVALDAVAGLLFNTVVAALGVSVAAASAAMLTSRRFPLWISVVGLVSGTLMMAGGVLLAGSGGEDGALRSTGLALQLGVPLFWLWMLAGGIYLWRQPRASGRAGAASA